MKHLVLALVLFDSILAVYTPVLSRGFLSKADWELLNSLTVSQSPHVTMSDSM